MRVIRDALLAWARRSGLLFLALAGAMGMPTASIAFAQDGASYGQSSYDHSTYNDAVLLDQGWSDDDRLRYFFAPQGSAAMSYDIFLNLEVADGEELFRSDQEVARHGLIPHPGDPKYNPDKLPIGLVKATVPEGQWKGEWVGLGCSACHYGQLQYKGKKISIAGGTAGSFDIYAFLKALDAALAATASNPQKFDRLAQKVGGDKNELRRRLEADAAAIHGYVSRSALVPHDPGPGRMDALGLIHNQVQMRMLGVPENWRAPLAPTKPSFVWNVPQSAWAQWSGVLPDPILRNVGEVMGVFARLDLTSPSAADGLFDSTVDVKGQVETEALLRRLAPPQWPESILGTIDREKAARGAQIFKENCSGCHSTWPHRWSEPRKQGKRFIENALVMADIVGTDPGQFRSPQFDFLPTIMSGPLAKHLPPPDTGALLMAPAIMFRTTIQSGVFDKAIGKLNLSDEERMSAHGYGPFDPEPTLPIPAVGAYKANPVEGMWSSPPFLHNGSVPNLYELLRPAKDRPKTFYVGREFDPVKVGVDTSGQSGTFVLDTALVGNSNAGHSFEDGPLGNGVIGRLLSEDERWALIEFIKSVPNAPAQIAPFGGPADPVRAWLDPTFYHVRHPGTYDGAPNITQDGQ